LTLRAERRDKWCMGDPLDFYIDEGGWPYPDDGDDDRVTGPEDLRATSDDDLVALHALEPHVLDSLTPTERAAVVARFGLDGTEPMTLAEVAESLGLSEGRARVAVANGVARLRSALGDGQP
jgi:DNA-directed RNA polymerase sigma subunit (sigma70/sigma32)